jgi:hypothetical protein
MPSAASIEIVKLVGFVDHQGQAELRTTLPRQCQADQATPVCGHVIHVGRTYACGRHQQVAFVLAILVIHHDDHFPVANVGDDVLDRRERAVFHPRMRGQVVRHSRGPSGTLR